MSDLEGMHALCDCDRRLLSGSSDVRVFYVPELWSGFGLAVQAGEEWGVQEMLDEYFQDFL